MITAGVIVMLQMGDILFQLGKLLAQAFSLAPVKVAISLCTGFIPTDLKKLAAQSTSLVSRQSTGLNALLNTPVRDTYPL